MVRSQALTPVSVPPPTPIQSCLDRLPHDPSARAELIVACRERVRRIVRRVMSRYPWLRPDTHFDDVEQDALMRLSRTLEAVPIQTTVHFLRLAAVQVKRAVVDILRKEYPRWANGRVILRLSDGLPTGEQTPTTDGGFGRLELYELFDRLGEWERRAIDCVHLLGMTQAETGAVFGVEARTVSRWLASAKLQLATLMGTEPRTISE